MENILSSVKAVRQRQQRQWMWQCVSTGLVAGGLVGCALAIARLIGEGSVPLLWIALAVIAGPILGCFWSMVKWRPTAAAASHIDQSCNLKDRIGTALSFSRKNDSDVLHQLQIQDADEKAASIDPEQVAPIKAPGTWLPGLGLAMTAIVMGVIATPTVAAIEVPVINSVVSSQALKAEAALEELKEFNQQETDPEIEEIIKELSEKIDELKMAGMDPKEALAKFSEMEVKLLEKQEQLETSSIEQKLQKVGEAMALAKPMQAAGEAMSSGKMDKAAEALEDMEMPALDRKTEKAVHDKLAKFAENDNGQAGKKVRDAVKKISEGMSSGKRGKFSEGVEGLASECKKQGRRKKLNDLLKKQCRCLSDCKGECECECEGNGNKKGGTKWGLAKSDNNPGEKTAKLKTGFKLDIKGQESDSGDIDVETIESAEQQQEAVREYRKQAKKYEQISESVLSEEAIPLGHRQTIRRYFEMIRPSGEETDAVKAETDQ